VLNRPDADNRMGPELAAEVREACRRVGQSDQLRVLVVTGSGGSFSVGREPQPAHLASGPLPDRLAWLEEVRVADALANLALPVIVSLNGDALDHGLELALAGDLRICTAEARLGLTDLSREGCLPWDGGTQRLPRLVGPAWAADMILTSRLVSAAEALAMGLVNRVVPAAELEVETLRLAQTIAGGGPLAARYAKEAVNQGRDLTLTQGLRLEADLNIILHSTHDRAEGLRSFREKRNPRFSGE
jgi:enoyl-CoA hydratase/carnithine racemase